jgi:hypothetical protein
MMSVAAINSGANLKRCSTKVFMFASFALANSNMRVVYAPPE